MRKICADKIIRKCIASLFKLHNTKRFYNMRECLEYIYKNYTKFRKFVDKCDDIEENILFNRLNARVLELFPQMRQGGESLYNNIYSSIKKADCWAVYSKTYHQELLEKETLSGSLYELLKKTQAKSNYLCYGADLTEGMIYQEFSSENFREIRQKNKQKLIKEFSKERVTTKFIDRSLFKDGEFKVFGYLDSFYISPLLFVTLEPAIFIHGIDVVFNVFLKVFQDFRNVQIIINIPNGVSSGYIKSWVDFMQTLPDIRGRWIFINSQINLAKFFAASDIFISPKRGNIVDGNFYEAMKYGCIPVLSRSGMHNDVVVDIFDDISKGCGFKTRCGLFVADDVNEIFYHVLKKALNMYMNNPASWNLLIKNAMNYDSGWNFEIIEQYNNLYEM